MLWSWSEPYIVELFHSLTDTEKLSQENLVAMEMAAGVSPNVCVYVCLPRARSCASMRSQGGIYMLPGQRSCG